MQSGALTYVSEVINDPFLMFLGVWGGKGQGLLTCKLAVCACWLACRLGGGGGGGVWGGVEKTGLE